MESDDRFYRRRANEEMQAASRAVTQEARERRMRLAGIFLDRLKASQESELAAFVAAPDERPRFQWQRSRSLEQA